MLLPPLLPLVVLPLLEVPLPMLVVLLHPHLPALSPAALLNRLGRLRHLFNQPAAAVLPPLSICPHVILLCI